MMEQSPRMAAFSLLMQQQKSGSYSNLLLEKSPLMQSYDARDRAFVTALFYGVIERLLTLDYNLSLYLQKPLKKLQPEALCLLRLGAYQLLFLSQLFDSVRGIRHFRHHLSYCFNCILFFIKN